MTRLNVDTSIPRESMLETLNFRTDEGPRMFFTGAQKNTIESDTRRRLVESIFFATFYADKMLDMQQLISKTL